MRIAGSTDAGPNVLGSALTRRTHEARDRVLMRKKRESGVRRVRRKRSQSEGKEEAGATRASEKG